MLQYGRRTYNPNFQEIRILIITAAVDTHIQFGWDNAQFYTLISEKMHNFKNAFLLIKKPMEKWTFDQ